MKLSQREAGSLLKVGENAFNKYERGLVEPSGPTSQLLRLLDHHPELTLTLLVHRRNFGAVGRLRDQTDRN
ncbi:hypothetical protein BTE77_16320 [Ensifer adhaerens]|nr:hypothetical protein BTE77_16320 [Ensifer adhaerens]